MLRKSAERRPYGFVEPCRPSKADRPPSGPQWVHEVKHDGFRLMVRRDGARVRCFTRNLIDGEAVICSHDGISDFNALRSRRRDHDVTLVAFDLIQLAGVDLGDHRLVDRKRRLASILPGQSGMALCEHLEHDGVKVFERACLLGLEGIVSKRLDAPYRSGPSKTWLKSKNPLSQPVRREGEEEWG